MNFRERKAKYERGGCGQNPLPENPNPPKWDGPREITELGQYVFLDKYGNTLPILFDKNLRIEHKSNGKNITEVIVRTTDREQMTYKERQKEIEIMMQSATDGQYLVTDGFTTLYGKKLENYTQKELFDTLKKLMGE